jgi:hypothetical protein
MTEIITEPVTQRVIAPNTHREQRTTPIKRTEVDGDTIEKRKTDVLGPINVSGRPTQNPTVLVTHVIP